MALLAHLALAFSVPRLPHPRHSPAVPAGCRAGRPALGPRPAAPLGTRTQVIAYHKPAGLIVTHNDELNRPTVYEHLAEQPGFPEGRWDAVGRLDLNTSGLLLLTNDGWLLRHVTDPTSGTTRLPKTYRVLASKVLGEAVLEQLRSGVELGGGLGQSGPAEVSLLGHGKGSTRLLLTIREGKNRQVRRMLHAVGSAVVRLERESVGTLSLGSLGSEEDRGGDTQLTLPVGAWRMLDEEEVRFHLEYEPRDLTPSRRAAPTTSRPPPPPLTATATATATAAAALAATTPGQCPEGQYREGQYPEGQYLLLDSGDQARLESMPSPTPPTPRHPGCALAIPTHVLHHTILATLPPYPRARPYCTTLHHTAPYCTILYHTVPYHTMLASRRGSRSSTGECSCGRAPRPPGARGSGRRPGAERGCATSEPIRAAIRVLTRAATLRVGGAARDCPKPRRWWETRRWQEMWTMRRRAGVRPGGRCGRKGWGLHWR
jgi:pseudouridine synthase